jgi:hypothetical protein
VFQVDRRHDEGHEGVAAVVLGVGEDGQVRRLELLLDVAGDVRVESAEDDVAVREEGGLALADNEVAYLRRYGRGLLPSYRIAVFLARRPGRGADGDEFEGGVLLEEEDEALPY